MAHPAPHRTPLLAQQSSRQPRADKGDALSRPRLRSLLSRAGRGALAHESTMSVRAVSHSDSTERIVAPVEEPRPDAHPSAAHHYRSLVAGALLAALLSSLAAVVVTQLWDQSLRVPFEYTQAPGDDQQDATLDLMLIKNVHESGWFDTNPRLNAPFAQHWAEWPMGGDLLAYVIKKGIVDATGNVALTFNLFWLLTFPLTALVAFPVLRALRCS